VDDAEAHLALRELMSGTSAETRYGAFRSLSVLDANDPFIRGEKLNDQFMLHVLATEGSPLVHLTNRRFAEVVLFNAEQEFQTPIAIKAGEHILITAPSGSETITVSRYELGKSHQRQQVSRRIADVVKAVSEMGASYPDVAQMLVQADNQQNLPGALEIDALPKAGRAYFRPDPNNPEKPGKSTRMGNSGLVPNLFDGEQIQQNMERAVDGSWDAPSKRSESDEDSQSLNKDSNSKEIAPQDDVLIDARKWYDPRRLLKPHDYATTEKPEEPKSSPESE
jgi:hypothetical protein